MCLSYQSEKLLPTEYMQPVSQLFSTANDDWGKMAIAQQIAFAEIASLIKSHAWGSLGFNLKSGGYHETRDPDTRN